MFYLLIFLIIDYLVIDILAQSTNAMELPNIITDAENGLDGDNPEGELLNVIAEDDLSNSETAFLIIVTTG